MIKTVFLFHRRPDMGPVDFTEYWRENHAAIARKLPGHCQRKVARTEFSTDDRELGRPELTPLGKRGGAVELEIVS